MNNKDNAKKNASVLEKLIDYRVDYKFDKAINQREVVIKRVYNADNHSIRRADVSFVEDASGAIALNRVPVNIPYPIQVGDRAFLFYLGKSMNNAWIGHLITYNSTANQDMATRSFVNNIPSPVFSVEGEEIKIAVNSSSILNRLVKDGKAQIWLYFERNVKRRVTNFVERKNNPDAPKTTLTYKQVKEWVHFEDKTPTAPSRLFYPKRRYMKGQGGLGYRAYCEKNNLTVSLPSYMKHNGNIPTEFSLVKIEDISNERSRICLGKHDNKWTIKLRSTDDILKQILVKNDKTPLPTSGLVNSRVKVLGLHGRQKRMLRHKIKIKAKLVVNLNGSKYESNFSNMLIISAPSNYATGYSFAWDYATGKFGCSVAEK